MLNAQRSVLYDVRWQLLRVSLLGKFVSKEGVLENLQKLDRYVKDSPTEQEEFYRLYRTINLLNGTVMGFSGMGLYDTFMHKQILEFRKGLQENYKKLQSQGLKYEKWDWDKVEKELRELYSKHRDSFDGVYKNLNQRRMISSKIKDISKTRAELLHFLDLMDKVSK